MQDTTPTTMSLVDIETAGYVPNVGDGFRTTFVFEGFEYMIIPPANKDKLAIYRGLVPRNPMGQPVQFNNPHWYYWSTEHDKWMEHYVPLASAEVVPIRPGVDVTPTEDDDKDLTFAGILNKVLLRLGGSAWIERQAINDPWKFLQLMGKTIPVEVKGNETPPVTVQVAVLSGKDGTLPNTGSESNTDPID